MIPERHMKQAKRLDNGELVVGSVIVLPNGGATIQCYNSDWSYQVIAVDPDTVEDVAVKPVLNYSRQNGACKVESYGCPNCGTEVKGISVHCAMYHCARCGQRIDWS